MSDLAALRVVVTGAAGGIGRAVCAAAQSGGAHVVAIDADTAGLSALDAETYALDVTNHGQVEQAFDQIGPLDVLILGAGVTSLGPARDTPLSAVDRVIDVNLRGSIYCAMAGLEGLESRRGRIGVVSSVAGFAPLKYRTAYAASKHGLHGFFESLRSEVDGVSVTMVAPSFVGTGIERRAVHGAGKWTTTGEITTPAAVAEALLDGVMARKRLVLPSRTARIAYLVSRAMPNRYQLMMSRRITESR